MNKTNQRTTAPRCNLNKNKNKKSIPTLFSYREN